MASVMVDASVHKVFGDATNSTTNLSGVINEILTWKFHDFNPDKITFTNAMRVMEGPSGHSLKFNGHGEYVGVASSVDDHVNNLVVSAWVKPDYTVTSNQFYIVTKDESFSLYLKSYDKSYHAVFSIFDGKKWHTVESKKWITPQWTHLTGIFDGASLGIYVNNIFDSSEIIESSNLKDISLTAIDFSYGDIVIGASGNDTTSNSFSGLIDELEISPLESHGFAGTLNNRTNAIESSNATSAIPSNATSAIPSNATSAIPSNATSAIPSNATSAIPSNATSAIPSNATSAIPSNATSAIPSNATSAIPSNATSAIPSNATSAIPSNATSAIPSNATSAIPSNATSAIPSNATSAIPSNATSAIPSNATSAIPSNATSAIPSNATSAIPYNMVKPLYHFEFNPNSILPENLFQNTTIADNGINGTALKLVGSGYVSLPLEDTNHISNFTVSVWVKPDYSTSHNDYTILSKQKSFLLTIHNTPLLQRIASFSVYDGMTWHTVESKSMIPQEWTNLVVTFDGTSISLFVNGVREDSTSISKVGISASGQIESSKIENFTSSSNVLIGSTLESQGQVTHQFTGLIDELSIYDSYLNDSEIHNMFDSVVRYANLHPHPLLPLALTTNLETPKPDAYLNFSSTTQNGTKAFGDVRVMSSGLNGSSLDLSGHGFVSKNINSTNQISTLTVSAWVNPIYQMGSAEYTVLSKENTFLLTIHNNIPPKKIASFSIYDGITWHTVESQSEISETWTHLAATFNGTAISIYVNGVLENSLSVNTMGISISGHLETKTIQNLQSPADVIIGAQESTRRGATTIQSLFGGQVDEVSIYKSVLSTQEIQQIYLQNAIALNTVPLPTNATVPLPTNATVPLPTNATVPLPTNATVPLPTNATVPLPTNATVPLPTNATVPLPTNATVPLPTNATVPLPTNATVPLPTNATVPLLISTSIHNHKNSFLMTEKPEFDFEFISQNSLKKLGKSTKESFGIAKVGNWTDNNSTIDVAVVDPDGNKMPVHTKFVKLREGKFDIQLDSKRVGKAGLYKLQITLVNGGQSFVTESTYAWGLVSLNTDKSIYRPGENAHLVIVVLDNAGHSVCNSDIVMNIEDPASITTSLSTGNGITANPECGLYDAQYFVPTSGNYTVDVTATNPSGTANFTTSFLAANSFPFEITRTAASKIDPTNNPNSFKVNIDISSFVDTNNIIVRESVPSVFDVTTDANVRIVGDTKVLTWDKNMIENKTSIQYSYAVPLVFPQLYALGPVEIDYGTQSFKEARPWFVANDPIHRETNSASTAGTTSPLNTGTMTSTNTHGRLVVVGVAMRGTQTITSVRSGTGTNCGTSPSANYNADTVRPSNTAITQIFYLKDNRTDTFNICVTFSAAPTRAIVAAAILSDVNVRTNPIGSHQGFSGTTPVTASQVFTNTMTNSTTGNTVFDILGIGGTSTTLTAASPAILLNTATGGAGGTVFSGGNSIQNATTSSVPIGWATTRTSTAYALSLISIKQCCTMSLSESLGLSDNISAKKSSTKSLSESLGLSDNISVKKSFVRYPSESLGLSDNISVKKSFVRYPSESLGLSDNISVKKSSTKSLSDSLSLSDGLSTYRSFTISLSESLYLTDQMTTKRITSSGLYGAIQLSDSLYVTKSISRTLSDAISLSDTTSTKKSLTESLLDSLGLFDNILTSISLHKSLSDTVFMTDSVSATKSTLQLLSDTASMTDSLSMTKSRIQSLANSLPLTDSVSATKSTSQSLVNSLPVTDSLSMIKSTTQSLDDSISMTDSVSMTKSRTQSLDDSISMTDSLSMTKSRIQSLANSLPLTDSVSATKSTSQSLAELTTYDRFSICNQINFTITS